MKDSMHRLDAVNMSAQDIEEFSTSLLQLLIAIRIIVESSDDRESFLDIVAHWYQSAVFVLDTLNSVKHSADDDLMGMLDIASNNKLDTDSIKGALLC